MSVFEYDSKFMELSRFAPAFVADERLKMNRFEAGLNPTIKERISVCQYASYINLYDTAVNVERVMKERSNYFNEHYFRFPSLVVRHLLRRHCGGVDRHYSILLSP